MGLVRHIKGVCWNCTEKMTGKREDNNRCIRTFTLVRAMVSYPGGHGSALDIRDCWECEECGEIVPVDTIQRYFLNKEIVVRQPPKIRRTK